MEILGVIFATALLILAVVYYTLFPSILNFIVACFFTWLFTDNKNWLSSVVCFFAVSLAFTFVTRVPDFAIDYFYLNEGVREIQQPITLRKGDTVNIANLDAFVEHRKAYFNTSGWQGHSWVGKIAGPDFYAEDISYLLELQGLRLNAGTPDPHATTLQLDIDQDTTHQTITLSLIREGKTTARYERRERLHFWDEVGAGRFRHHILHMMKNSAWNWLIRIFTKTEFRPLTSFINEALKVEPGEVAIPNFDVGFEARVLSLKSFKPGQFDDAFRNKFDCPRYAKTNVSTSGLKTRISSNNLRLNLNWPVADLGVNQSSYMTQARVLRISCGVDGYMVWISADSNLQRIIVTDQNWLPKASFNIVVPDLTRREGRQFNVMNFYQRGQSLMLEVHIRDRKALADGNRDRIVAVQFEHPELQLDYGSGAKRWTSFNLFGP